MNNTMEKVLVATAVFLAVHFVGGTSVSAQPDENNAPKGINPPNRDRGVAGAKAVKKRIKKNSDEIQSQLTEAGFTDPALQTTILNYYQSEQEASSKVNEQYQKIVAALKDKATADAQLAPMLKDLRASVAGEKSRQEKADETLRVKLNLDDNPRLDALLMTLGVIGTERALATRAAGLDTRINSLNKAKLK